MTQTAQTVTSLNRPRSVARVKSAVQRELIGWAWLAVGALVSFALATGTRPLFYAPLIVVAAVAYGALFTPAFAMIADGADQTGLAQGMAFGLMSAAWATGAAAGPAAGGAIANATGDWFPFVLGAVLCASILIVVRPRTAPERGLAR